MRARRPPISALRLAGLSAALFVVAALVAPKPVRAQSLAPGGAAAIPARELFGAASGPAPLAARAVGFYSKGCLAGGAALPVTGATWQVMRLSRNRNWGHPDLIDFLERFAAVVPQVSNWRGILVGDMAQPRGGPMRTGHASHQVGLDADIWLTPSPGHELTRAERESLSATLVVRPDRLDVDPKVWTPDHIAVIRAAALDPRVERIFVNAAIKKALCRDARGDRAWMTKVRPYWGHDYHMHVRLSCPADSPDCRPQEAPPQGDGCGADLAWWFTDEVLHPKPPKVPPKPTPPLLLADLPSVCAAVLGAH
ncbi:MAG: penicillin-insensitive murein endopeptidase [Rhizobiales bacterium 24-66-13]|jgi:penicillin-insensitive murein endopeptidase|nr:MAG: penicillin-insensitive murein endopeptidase [Rhizobiales bacterium 24-66-13]OZB06342.1 MAG: penicillin-insensitive murein endopeptidase [Rhizobiales bacterium 39-66-18]HQS47921.1 penicillin-insensitive murein endopeptidase [Xanthobacteraceae bacterium]